MPLSLRRGLVATGCCCFSGRAALSLATVRRSQEGPSAGTSRLEATSLAAKAKRCAVRAGEWIFEDHFWHVPPLGGPSCREASRASPVVAAVEGEGRGAVVVAELKFNLSPLASLVVKHRVDLAYR